MLVNEWIANKIVKTTQNRYYEEFKKQQQKTHNMVPTLGHIFGNGNPSSLQYIPAKHLLQSLLDIAEDAFL